MIEEMMLAGTNFALSPVFCDYVPEAVNVRTGTAFRPFREFPAAHVCAPFYSPARLEEVTRLRKQIKNIRQGKVINVSVDQCQAEIAAIRDAEKVLWETRKTCAFWWAGLLQFLDKHEWPLLPLRLHELPSQVVAFLKPSWVAREPLRQEQHRELVGDAIKIYQTAWVDHVYGRKILPQIGKYAKAREVERKAKGVWGQLARRLRALNGAGETAHKISGGAPPIRKFTAAIQAMFDVHGHDPIVEWQRLLRVKFARANRDAGELPAWLRETAGKRANMSGEERAHLEMQLSTERAAIPAEIEPEEVYEALRLEDQRHRRIKDPTRGISDEDSRSIEDAEDQSDTSEKDDGLKTVAESWVSARPSDCNLRSASLRRPAYAIRNSSVVAWSSTRTELAEKWDGFKGTWGAANKLMDERDVLLEQRAYGELSSDGSKRLLELEGEIAKLSQ